MEQQGFTPKLRSKELVENLADTTSQISQLQQNLFENKKKKTKKLETEFEKKNFENMIFKKKLVALLLDRHFALAASFQLFGYKAWKEFRETSQEIIFSKMMRDKELRHQLRREQLDYKDLGQAALRHLALISTFEGNSFADSSFTEEIFEEENFTASSLEESSFEDSSFEDSSFEDSSFEESSFAQSSFEESSLEEQLPR